MGDAMLIMRKRLIPGARVEEGLRLSAAMLGMDYPPLLVFADNGVEILMPEALYKNSLRDYLEVMSQMAGLYVLEESLTERGYTCLLYTSPSPRDQRGSRMPSSA